MYSQQFRANGNPISPFELILSALLIMVESRVGVVTVLCLLVGAGIAANCGQKKTIVQSFIANAYRAMAGSWPWHGALFHKNRTSERYTCGVTILSERVVITAAHCTFDADDNQPLRANQVSVKVGVTNLAKFSKHAQQIGAEDIIRHEEYDEWTYEDDIALIKLDTNITYSGYVQPICLWQEDASLSKVLSQVCYIAGWGLDETSSYPKDLNEATVPIVTKRDCIASNPDHYTRVYHDPKTFCAGYRNGTAAGPGDSGGGMFIRKENVWFIRGIVSNGRRDPNTLKIDTTSLVVFTDVAYYLDWIRGHVTIDIGIMVPPPSTVAVRTQPDLLEIASCGKDKYPLGTPEEFKLPMNQYPWLAVVEFYNPQKNKREDLCHGVLIHPKFVLTVAHCVKRKDSYILRSVRLNDFRLGTEEDIFESNGKKVRIPTERIAIVGRSPHPDHNKLKFAHNIALLKLRTATTMTPICLPPKGLVLPTDVSFNIIGWKKYSRQEKPLIRNVVQLAEFGKCSRMYAEENITLDTSGGQVCSTYNHDDDDGGKCSHYMGSAPFQYVINGPTEGRYFLAAISNFGHVNCRRDDIPDVFTNVAHYADWIKDKVMANDS